MEDIITRTEKQSRIAFEHYQGAMVRVINQADYEIGKLGEALSAIDSIISLMSCSANNEILVEALQEIINVEESMTNESTAKLGAFTDIRMNIDRIMGGMRERVDAMRVEFE
jgi:hypothetical protein